MKCQQIKEDGTRCGQSVGSGETLCIWHDPEREEEARAARVLAGQRSAESRRKRVLDDADLPPLTSHAAAEVWTDEIGRAAATGRISGTAAQAALRAVKEWREARDHGAVADEIEEMKAALQDWKKTGSPDRIMELVK